MKNKKTSIVWPTPKKLKQNNNGWIVMGESLNRKLLKNKLTSIIIIPRYVEKSIAIYSLNGLQLNIIS